MVDDDVEMIYASGGFVGENSEPLLCRSEDGLVVPASLSMMMFHGDPLIRRITEIIELVVKQVYAETSN
jgi:hypothetical protein